MGNCDTKVDDWIGCFSPGGKSLNYDLGNCDTKVGYCKGEYSWQKHKQTATLLI